MERFNDDSDASDKLYEDVDSDEEDEYQAEK